MRFSYAIFLVASLGFLGLGCAAAVAGLGPDVVEAPNLLLQPSGRCFFPLGAIALLVSCRLPERWAAADVGAGGVSGVSAIR